MKKVVQIIYTAYAWFICCFLWCIGYIISAISTIGVKDKENRYNNIERVITRITFRFMGINIDVKGRENIPNNEPVIFVINHQSFLDIKLLIAAIPNNISFVSKDALFKIPILGKYMKISGHISIRRNEESRAYATLNEVIKKLEFGKSVVFFPEGTRSSNGKLGEFKRGISKIILKSGRKVVPTAIIGSGKFLPKNRFLSDPKYRNILFKFGKPLEFPKMEKRDKALSVDIMAKLRHEVSNLLYN